MTLPSYLIEYRLNRISKLLKGKHERDSTAEIIGEELLDVSSELPSSEPILTFYSTDSVLLPSPRRTYSFRQEPEEPQVYI